MPNLLVAPTAAKTPQEKDPYAPYEPRGECFYSDGAYVAVPLEGTMDEQFEDSEVDPQETYYTALLERFESLRMTLSTTPPSSAPQIDPTVRSIIGKPRAGPWKHALFKSRPTPILLCSLPNESTIFGIEVLESLLTMKNLSGGVRHRLGAWAWGLLGRCRDVSEMDSEDVSVLRGLGKKACALLRRLRAGEELLEDEEGDTKEDSNNNAARNNISGNGGGKGNGDSNDHDDQGDSIHNQAPESALAKEDTHGNDSPGNNSTGDSQIEEVSLEETRTRLLAGLFGADQAPLGESEDPQVQHESAESVQVSDAHAMLDIIVTLVGECYGQRDLLDARLAWEEL